MLLLGDLAEAANGIEPGLTIRFLDTFGEKVPSHAQLPVGCVQETKHSHLNQSFPSPQRTEFFITIPIRPGQMSDGTSHRTAILAVHCMQGMRLAHQSGQDLSKPLW